MISKHQKFKLQRVGFTLLATFASYVGLVLILTLVYAVIFGRAGISCDDVILGIEKIDAFQWMLTYMWIPLKWLGISIGLLFILILLMVVPFLIFRAIYKAGHDSVREAEKRLS